VAVLLPDERRSRGALDLMRGREERRELAAAGGEMEGLGLGFEGFVGSVLPLQINSRGEGRWIRAWTAQINLGRDPWEEGFCLLISPRQLVLTTF
jgi:hypothetical protein